MGQATSFIWLGSLGPVVSSSIKAGDTLSGTAQWTVAAPGAQTIAISVNGAQAAVQGADPSGTTTFALDTATLSNGSNSLAVTVTWSDGATTTVPIGSVTVANSPTLPPPVVARPLIAKPTIAPKRPTAGTRQLVTFTVTRSDNRQPLMSGTLICRPSVNGNAIAHAASFVNGQARLTFTVPKAAKHQLLKVKVIVRLGTESTTRIATFLVG
jgi:hypothetical protein